ncbi:MAG: hypothetical protein CSA33_04475 [Desulfobulbus propionicus]|nr:MAG: hypothetical protein CSA33_04475 [Desulfobulbus propionicus]
MARVNDFLRRINTIEGIKGSMIVKKDGRLVAHRIKNPEKYSSLLVICNNYALSIMKILGSAYCKAFSFTHGNDQGFHVFPIQGYYLGVVRSPEVSAEKISLKINMLLSLVQDKRSN